MNIMIACEESQTVCKAFRELGHNAFSFDLQNCSGGRPEWHVLGDCTSFIDGACFFHTLDGVNHFIDSWDVIIAHPPCTYLTAAGAVRLFYKNGQIKDPHRYLLGLQAAEFFYLFYNCSCKHVCIENPLPLSIFGLPEYSQVIQPFYFGDPWYKTTCLWLRGLPELIPSKIVNPVGYWVSSRRRDKLPPGMIDGTTSQKKRSKTFPGIAAAMAAQWGQSEILEYCDTQLALF